MEVTNPTMVVVVEQLWATKTGDLNDPNPMMLVDNQENCAILHPDVTEVPEANPFDANREFLKFPYIAYELDPAMFDSKLHFFSENYHFLIFVKHYFRGWVHTNFYSFRNKSLCFISRKLFQTSMSQWSDALAAHT